MSLFKTKQIVQENDIRKAFFAKMPSDVQKLRLVFKEDGRKEVPRKYLEIVLDQCLELMNLREVVKLFGQYKQKIKQGIDEEEHLGWHHTIQEAKKKLIDTNSQLFDQLELKTQHLAQAAQEKPLTRHNSEELEHQFAQLNHTRNAINLLSELIGKALNKQQVHEQLPKIENFIPKEMQNMLALLKHHLNLQQSLEKTKQSFESAQKSKPLESTQKFLEQAQHDFLNKLKKIGQALLHEKEDLAPFEDSYDGNQINHLFDRITTFIKNNQASLKNLHIFNQEIVNSLENFIRQILQPLQKKKPEEINVVYILNNIGDVKYQLQRVLASYKDYLQVNDQNSQEMEIKIKNYQNQEEENEKKLQALEEESKKKDAHIQRLTTEAQKRNDELADVREKLVQKAKANKQLEEQNKTFQSMLSSIRRKLADLSQQKIQSEPAHSFQDVEDILARLEKDMKDMIESLNKAAAMIQSLTKQLRDSKESQIKLQKANTQSMKTANKISQQLKKVREEKQKNELLLKESQEKLEREKTEYDGKLKQLTREMQALNKAKHSLKLDINELSKRQAEAQREKEELLKKIANQRDYQRYFANEVLYDFSYYKKTIIETIQARNYLEVKATKLLFRFDPLNKVNFHRYIDEKPNILVLIKLENGRMLACYTNHPFKPQCIGEDAFIMALNTGNTYELKKGARAISYDEYYLLFGNSEIRLRSGESLIFSNFGIANSNFDNKNQSVDALFGEGKDKRELPIAGYEIYQIIFEEER